MDPLTAVGLAGNIIQFVDFAGKLVPGAVTLYNGPKLENLEMETLIEDIKMLAQTTRTLLGLSKEGQLLQTLSNQCLEVYDALLSVLQSPKVKGNRKVFIAL
jgi:hypothetical protein